MIRTINVLLFSTLLAVLFSCNGQNATHSANAQHESVGDTVHETGKNIWCVFEDKNHNLWFGSNGQGAYRYDGKTLVQFSEKDGLHPGHIRRVQEDRSGNIYFTTRVGIYKFDGRSFTHLKPGPDTAWKLKDGDMWFEGEQEKNGPYRYDGKTLSSLKFPKMSLDSLYYARFPEVKNSPYGIYTLHKDKKGHMWFGTTCFGVCRYDGSVFTWFTEKELTELDDGPSFGVRSILEDQNGDFWFNNILYRYRPYPKDSAGPQRADYRKEKGMTNVLVDYNAMIQDRLGAYWLVTYNDVSRYENGKMTQYKIDGLAPGMFIQQIFEDHEGGLWLAIDGMGVYKFSGAGFVRFSF